MDRVEYVKPSFPVDAFTGTAIYYAQYRVPYPKALIDDLLNRAGIAGDGKLLDLEPQMIEVGQKESKKKGLNCGQNWPIDILNKWRSEKPFHESVGSSNLNSDWNSFWEAARNKDNKAHGVEP